MDPEILSKLLSVQFTAEERLLLDRLYEVSDEETWGTLAGLLQRIEDEACDVGRELAFIQAGSKRV